MTGAGDATIRHADARVSIDDGKTTTVDEGEATVRVMTQEVESFDEERPGLSITVDGDGFDATVRVDPADAQAFERAVTTDTEGGR